MRWFAGTLLREPFLGDFVLKLANARSDIAHAGVLTRPIAKIDHPAHQAPRQGEEIAGGGNRDKIEEKRLKFAQDSIDPQLAAKQATVDQLKASAELKVRDVEALHVKAGMAGVLQQLPVEVGQRVVSGTNLARVADPTKLKAQIKIAETQAKDIQINQPASIDTRNGVVEGHVTRVDPAVEQGTVTVDVALDGALPKGARLAFVLHDVEGYQHQEIAEQLGVSVGTIKAQLHRARRLLRERLER